MTHQNYHDSRTPLKAVPRKAAAKSGKARRFQVGLELKGVLSGSELIEELAKFNRASNTLGVETAILSVERFIEAKLAEGYQLDFNLASFKPHLSGALTTRDADPESDGLCVLGAVSARPKLRNALKDKVTAVNVLAKKFIRIYNVFDKNAQTSDKIAAGHTLSVVGNDICIDPSAPDEGFFLEKRSGHWNRKPRVVQQAEILESTDNDAQIVFNDPIARGKYNLVVATRCGEGKDYKLRRIGHPVTA